ncbi:MAG: TonB-dependent receptor [Ferruginibacter sp.]|nr:TonB-dependent receptor [Ferruginibacter sp.]
MPMLVFLSFSFTGFSQKNFLTGIIKDTAEKKNLHYAMISLVDESDSSLYITVRSDEAGAFEINKIPQGKYTLMVSYPHMADYLQPLIITDTSKIKLGKIDMVSMQVLLDEVIIKSGAPPIRMRGDTLEYNADSFAVKQGANVQELLKRLPGIFVDRKGKITAQGKEVKKILVDGDEFFGDDPGLATQFLNADAIDKMQVFDKKSDQADFTGIDDGKRTKTINLKLKANKKNGAFGKAAVGSDGDKYHDHQAMASLFNGAKKMSVFGLSSKTGKEGLGYNELSSYIGQDYELIDDGTGTSFTSNNDDGDGNYYGGGLPDIKSGGAHYSNKWKDGKQKLLSNYRIKQINSVNWNTSLSVTKLPDGTGFVNQASSTATNYDFSQKASGSFTAQLDSFSTLKVSVNGRMYSDTGNTSGYSSSKNEKELLVSNSNNNNKSFWSGNNLGGNVTYQHKFKKEGRSLTMLAQQNTTDWHDDEYNYSHNNYYAATTGIFTRADTLDQLQRSHNTSSTFATQVTYVEKLSSKMRLSVDYAWKKINTKNKFSTYNNNGNQYTNLLDTLSNNYNFNIATSIAGTSLGYNTKKISFTVGSRVYFTGFKQINNDAKNFIKRNFTNVAPQANFNYRPKDNTALSLTYAGATFQPSADQLQPLRKSSNNLYVQIGNPQLAPGFRHSIAVNFYQYIIAKSANINANFSMDYTQNDIRSKSSIDAQNRTVSQYINLNSIPGFNGSIDYGWQIKKYHLRPSIRLNAGTYGSYNFLNEVKVKNNNLYGGGSVSVSYDLENKLGVSYNGSINFNKSRSSISNASTRQTISHTHDVNVIKYFPKKIELTSGCIFNFQPRNGSFASSINTVQWNASLTKKLLKNDRGFVKCTINDILNNNTGYSRNVDGSNTYESDRLVIKRYFLVTVGWNFLKSL